MEQNNLHDANWLKKKRKGNIFQCLRKESDRPIKSQLKHLPAMWLWVNYLMSLKI